MTDLGFCVVAALSRYTSGRPWTRWLSAGHSARLAATSNAGVGGALGMRHPTQGLFEQGVRAVAHTGHADAVDDLAGEGLDEHMARVGFRHASRPQVEQCVFIELADRRAVR